MFSKSLRERCAQRRLGVLRLCGVGLTLKSSASMILLGSLTRTQEDLTLHIWLMRTTVIYIYIYIHICIFFYCGDMCMVSILDTDEQ